MIPSDVARNGEQIADPAVLSVELDLVRHIYNNVRHHEAGGYVTPDDGHHGRGETICDARRQGLERAHENRLAYHRHHTDNTSNTHPGETP